MDREFDLIIGIHSVVAALSNPAREIYLIAATEEGLKEIYAKGCRSRISDKVVKKLTSHQFQEEAKKYYQIKGHQFSRIPSQVFLLVSPLEIHPPTWVFDSLKTKNNLKLFCLDQVSDVQNGAAIMRTAAFFGVDGVILSIKGSFGLSPAFYRVASGATEFVKIIKCPNLSKMIVRMQDLGVECIGLTEDGESRHDENITESMHRCLIVGAEDLGISNAVERVLKKKLSLQSKGSIKTLNVSTASAIAMQIFF